MNTATLSAAVTPITYDRHAALAAFSVARYQRMIEAGILTAEDKVELLENYVVLKMPRNPAHDGTLDLVSGALANLPLVGWFVRVQQTIVLADSQPEPDFTLVRGNRRSYLLHHPEPAEIGLVIEVADSSLLRDQRDKARIYARANIAAYWIVNLVDRRLEVYSQPSGPTPVPSYGAMHTFQTGDVAALVLGGQQLGQVAVADLLP